MHFYSSQLAYQKCQNQWIEEILDNFNEFPLCQTLKLNNQCGEQCYKLLLALILEQLSYWCVRVLLEEVNHLTQCVLLNEILLSVAGNCSSAADGRAIAIDAAVYVPYVFWDIDTFDIIFDDPVVSRGNGTNQHVGLVTLSSEHVSQVGLMTRPRILVQFWVLRHHIREGERGITTWHCVNRRG